MLLFGVGPDLGHLHNNISIKFKRGLIKNISIADRNFTQVSVEYAKLRRYWNRNFHRYFTTVVLLMTNNRYCAAPQLTTQM